MGCPVEDVSLNRDLHPNSGLRHMMISFRIRANRDCLRFSLFFFGFFVIGLTPFDADLSWASSRAPCDASGASGYIII